MDRFAEVLKVHDATLDQGMRKELEFGRGDKMVQLKLKEIAAEALNKMDSIYQTDHSKRRDPCEASSMLYKCVSAVSLGARQSLKFSNS